MKATKGEDRFYVYALFEAGKPEAILYVGKGSGTRLASQRSKYKLDGQVIKRFKKEKDAFAFEREMIAAYSPEMNKCAGGNGGTVRKRARRFIDAFYRDCEKYGTQVMAARVLLKFDLSGYIDDPSKLEAIRQVAYGGRA